MPSVSVDNDGSNRQGIPEDVAGATCCQGKPGAIHEKQRAILTSRRLPGCEMQDSAARLASPQCISGLESTGSVPRRSLGIRPCPARRRKRRPVLVTQELPETGLPGEIENAAVPRTVTSISSNGLPANRVVGLHSGMDCMEKILEGNGTPEFPASSLTAGFPARWGAFFTKRPGSRVGQRPCIQPQFLVCPELAFPGPQPKIPSAGDEDRPPRSSPKIQGVVQDMVLVLRRGFSSASRSRGSRRGGRSHNPFCAFLLPVHHVFHGGRPPP